MMTEEQAWNKVLLEDIQSHVKVIAEGHGALATRLDRIENKFDRLEGRVERLEFLASDTQQQLKGLTTKVDGLEVFANDAQQRLHELTTKVDGLEVFANDGQQRLQRIETRLQLNGSRHVRMLKKPVRSTSSKRRSKR